MNKNDLGKNITTILGNKYVIPLYQRNFAWEEEEIRQLLQDIYEAYGQNKDKPEKGNYYIGSLVVIKRNNGDYEVIDGQQRLTAITLIARILDKDNNDNKKEPKLFYDSRPEVEAFYNSFYQSKDLNEVAFDYKISHLVNAVGYIKESKLNRDENETVTIETIIESSDFNNFKQFFFNNVILVFVELPLDTDVAAYFEIMNNRGEQLKKHEILKAKLLEKLKNNNEYDRIKQEQYSKIWNACSQMNTHIQRLFIAKDRSILFGDDYTLFPNREKIEQLYVDTTEISGNFEENADNNSINSILDPKNIYFNKNRILNDEDDSDDDDENQSIIDFPNFLMHIFKLKYNSEIPLNEKMLLKVYDEIEDDIIAEDFISDLLYYRTVFDRYMVKQTKDDNNEEKFKWTLKKPNKKESGLYYKNLFDSNEEQNRAVMALSMLQVSFRTRIYKEWLQHVLGWFKERKDINFINKLDNLILSYYKLENDIDKNEHFYAEGTRTPHFLFNFIDYLYWVKDEKFSFEPSFDFRYRNSIEHHLPQSSKGDSKIKDNLGNLCLVSKSSNSRMNNEEPEGKAKEGGKYYTKTLPPKRKRMYDLTNKKNSWGKEEIESHYKNVKELLTNRKKILLS